MKRTSRSLALKFGNDPQRTSGTSQSKHTRSQFLALIKKTPRDEQGSFVLTWQNKTY